MEKIKMNFELNMQDHCFKYFGKAFHRIQSAQEVYDYLRQKEYPQREEQIHIDLHKSRSDVHASIKYLLSIQKIGIARCSVREVFVPIIENGVCTEIITKQINRTPAYVIIK